MTNRGIHWSASTDHASCLANWSYWRDELKSLGVGWVKLLDAGNGSSIEVCKRLLDMGITPVVRLYRGQPGSGRLPADSIEAVRRLVGVGVKYFEAGNEPNLRTEWEYGSWMSLDWKARVAAVMASWIVDAHTIIALGGMPAFPALAQCAHTMTEDATGSIPWTIEAVRCLAQEHASDAKYIWAHGGWIAAHMASLNHPFDYPNDPINQKDHPGATVMQDDCCLRGYGVISDLVSETFGVDPPVISTEGGVFVPKNGSQQWDNRYPPLTYDTQATLTVSMFEWLAKNAPQVIAMCPWLIANEKMGHPAEWENDAWFHRDGPRPVVAAMKVSVPPAVEPLDAIRNAAWQAVGIAFNPEAAFGLKARELVLGNPVTNEFDVGEYRAQGFAYGILWAKVGDWANVKVMEW